MQGHPDLLQTVANLLQPDYVSDLRGNRQAAGVAAALHAEQYTLHEWQDAVYYLTDCAAPVNSIEQARCLLQQYAAHCTRDT